MIKVIIVDDHPIVLDGIKQLLDEQPDITVAGTAMSGRELYELLNRLVPDVILLDINLTDTSGIYICAEVRRGYPAAAVIALTGFSEYSYVDGMLRNGAKGYLLKNAFPDEIIEAVRTVYRGGEYFADFAVESINSRKKGGKLFLTNRERELLALVVEGYTSREIAEKLFLGVETVNVYRKHLLLKMGVRNTAAMVKMAVTEKLV